MKVNSYSDKTFKEYLQENAYSETTVSHYLDRTQEFTYWLKKRNIEVSWIDYKTTLKYVGYLQSPNKRGQKTMQVQTINNHIAAIRKYFEYLIVIGIRLENPLEDVSVKGTVKKVWHNLLSADELEDLYYSYNTEAFSKYSNITAKLSAKRNKIITGLIVYQGLNATNLKSLRLEDLQIYKGKLYVPSTKRNNARELDLRPWQVMDLLEYVNEIRPQIAKGNDIYNDRLLIPQKYFNDLLRKRVVKSLKKINHKVVNVNQLRASVIVNWLKVHHIRKVQYLAGHRYISSTEKYKQDDLEGLHRAINQFHPLQ